MAKALKVIEKEQSVLNNQFLMQAEPKLLKGSEWSSLHLQLAAMMTSEEN